MEATKTLQFKNDAERKFARVLTKKGVRWEYQPIIYLKSLCPKQGRHRRYYADFYCPDENIYYEVSATRQAYSLSRYKIREAEKANGNIRIAVVKPNGRPYNLYQERRLLIFKNLLRPTLLFAPKGDKKTMYFYTEPINHKKIKMLAKTNGLLIRRTVEVILNHVLQNEALINEIFKGERRAVERKEEGR